MPHKACWIPIIAAAGFKEIQTDALHARADDRVVKPFRLAELLARVQVLLSVRHWENDIDRALAYCRELTRNFAATR